LEQRAPRERLIYPVAAVVTIVWAAAAVYAIATGKTAVLIVVAVPFGLLAGFVFGGLPVGRRRD
jgi:hypothetical protein